VIRDIKAGEAFSSENVRVIRPGDGLHPKFYDMVIGKKAKKDISRGTPLDLDLI
jgi:pseudaminic acid synthase